MDTLKEAISFLEKQINFSSDSSWWSSRQKYIKYQLVNSKNQLGFLKKLMSNNKTGFQHQIYKKSEYNTNLIKQKYKIFQNEITNEKLLNYSENESILNESNQIINGKNINSSLINNIYIAGLIDKYFKYDTVLEIGGGYGALASIILNINPNTKYFIIDLPASCACQYNYLKYLNPNKKIIFFDINKTLEKQLEFDVILISSENINVNFLKKYKFDLIVNVSSFQEMKQKVFLRYSNLIFEQLSFNGFFSHNYFLNMHFDKKTAGEISLNKPKIIPFFPNNHLKEKFNIIKFEINNSLLSIDASERNWLTFLLKKKELTKKKNYNISFLQEKILFSFFQSNKVSLLYYFVIYFFVVKFWLGYKTKFNTFKNNLLGLGELKYNFEEVENLSEIEFISKINNYKNKNNMAIKIKIIIKKIIFYFLVRKLKKKKTFKTFVRIKREDLPSILSQNEKKFYNVY